MAFEKINSSGKKTAVRVCSNGSLIFNISASQRMYASEVKRLAFLWDKETFMLRMVPVSDGDGRSVSYARKGNSCTLFITKLLESIGVRSGATGNFDLEFNQDGSIDLVFTPSMMNACNR